MTRIFIENYELDINKSLSNQITYAIDDIRNVDSKATAFTKTIVLPGTAKNNNLLGNIFEFNNSNFTNDATANVLYNFNASKAAKCRIDVDGLPAIKGIFRLKEIIRIGNDVEYECAVFGELGGFIAKLGNNLLEDLDFSEYDHVYSIANITGSWANENAGAGYIYPHIDFGTYSTLKHDWKYGTFRPAFFVKEYIEKIAAAAGYTLDFPLSLTDRFKRLGVPHNQKNLTRNTSNFAAAYHPSTRVLFADGIDTPIDKSPCPLTTIQVASNFIDNSSNGAYEYTGITTIPVSYNIIVSGIIQSSASTDFHIGIKGSSADVYGTAQFIDYRTVNHLGGSDVYFTFEFTGTTSLGTTDAIKMYACTDSAIASSGQTIDLTVTIGAFEITGLSPALVDVVIGNTLTVNDSIPKNISQKDFFTSILKLFNLYVTEDKFKEKHLVITPYPDYYSGVEDWSNRLDRSGVIKIKPMSELNARYYQFKFRKDNDYWNELYFKRYNEGYGDRIFDSTYEFAQDTQEVNIVFAGTPLVGYSGEEKVYSTIFKQNNSIEERVDSVIRIVQFKKITGVASWDIKDAAGSSTLGSYTEYLYAGHLNDPDVPANDINFGVPKELFFVLVSGDISVNQFNVYYSSYMAEITDKDSRLLDCKIKMTDLDAFNLDFATYKYIDGGLYRLMKVKDYTPGLNETVQCELLRVINQTY